MLLDVEVDRAVLASGWGPNGVDIYQLTDGQPPQFRQFTRTLGWWSNGVSRQDNALYLSSGYWGVQKIDLQQGLGAPLPLPALYAVQVTM